MLKIVLIYLGYITLGLMFVIFNLGVLPEAIEDIHIKKYGNKKDFITSILSLILLICVGTFLILGAFYAFLNN